MGRTHDNISFLSDYGLDDEFVGVCKSVIRQIAPTVQVIDITHNVAPFDVRGGALALSRAVQYMAPGVVLAVVDPGVGSQRRAIAVEVGDDGQAVMVGPDNGLLAAAVGMVGGARRAVELQNEKFQLTRPGETFAGRDVFAPAAAHLCNGVDLLELGAEIDPFTLMPGMLALPSHSAGEVKAEVLWVDRFGNAQLNLGPDELVEMLGSATIFELSLPGEVSRRARSVLAFADLQPNEVGLVTDSYGLVALALNSASAASALRLAPGSGVSLKPA
jgi:hypothetical protein